MREAAPSARLQSKSNLVVHADGHHRRRRIRRDNYFQSVRQCSVLDRDLQTFHAFPPAAFSLAFFAVENRSNSARVPAVSCASTSAARRFTASYAWENSLGASCTAFLCASITS